MNMKVKQLNYDVVTRQMVEEEIEIDFPNPRISEIDRRLQEIRTELTQGDWKTIKYAEGGLPEEEFQKHLAERIALRDTYNTLEAEKLEAPDLMKDVEAVVVKGVSTITPIEDIIPEVIDELSQAAEIGKEV
jgi:hypothetical protein